MSIDYMEKLNAVVVCNTVQDILDNPKLNIVEDYAFILQGLFEDDLRAEFVYTMLRQGEKELVAGNIDAVDVNTNWKIAKYNPNFKAIFFQNFDKSLEKSANVYDYTLNEIGTASTLTDNDDRIFGKDVVTSNWEQISEKVDNIGKIKLMKILKTTEDGRKVLNEQFPKLFYGTKSYNFFIQNLLRENLASREQIAELIVQEPTRMLSESFEVEEDYFDAMNFTALLEQIDELLETTPTVSKVEITQSRENIEGYLAQNFEKLLERIKVNTQSHGGTGYPISDLKLLKSFDTDKHLINKKLAENFEEISSNVNKKDIMDVIHLFSDTGVLMEGFDVEKVMKQTFSNIRDEDLQWAISRMTTELLEDQKISLKEMEMFGRGNYSRSMKIGEYIFKVGDERSTTEIPYDRRIIQPLTRRKLEGKNGEDVYVEVQNLVDKDWYKGLTDEEVDEELYKIYAEMRGRGHRWTDVRKDNVGRLLKPNERKFDINGNEIVPEDSAIGFTNRDDDDVLPAGELVIIDTDYIYEENSRYSGSIASAHGRFEERYLKECAERDAKRKLEQPAILASAIEVSKKQVSNRDIQQMSASVVDNQRNKDNLDYERQEEQQEYSK